jgi:hypothetical protein
LAQKHFGLSNCLFISENKLQKSNPDSCHTSFKFKTKEQLNQDFAILEKKFQEKEKEYRKIKNKFEESDLLSKSDDDDFIIGG